MKLKTPKKKTKSAIVKPRRAEGKIPEIYVKVPEGLRTSYARAHIRVKGGQYHYLVWRDGDRVLDFYLGKKRNP